MSGLFEYLSPEEFEKQMRGTAPAKPATAKGRRTRVPITEPRNNTTWYALSPHVMGFCNCHAHDEIQQMLNPTAKVYRQKYPVRMTYEITPGLFICRDCFIHEGDK